MPWCMPGSLTRGFLWNRWRAKRSRHSRRMRNPQFYVSGKRPMLCCQVVWCPVTFNPLTRGVKATTSNLMVLGGSGQMPPSVFSHINVICYLKRLHHLPSWMIVKQMYIELCRLHECGFVTWVRVRVRVRVRKLYLKSDKVKQCNISSHLKWVLVADKSMHIIKVQ